MSDVQEGDLIRWNGRQNPQPVVEKKESQFEVESWGGSRFRFFTFANDGPSLVNLNSDRRYTVSEFEIVGELKPKIRRTD